MDTPKETRHIYALAEELLEEKEPRYGDAWKQSDFDTVFSQIERKSMYLKNQKNNGFVEDEKFKEDLLDLANWCFLVYRRIEIVEGK